MLNILLISLQAHSRSALGVGSLMDLDLSLLLSNPLLHIAKNAMLNSKLIHPVDHLKSAFVVISLTASDSKNKPLRLQAVPNATPFTKLIPQVVLSKNA